MIRSDFGEPPHGGPRVSIDFDQFDEDQIHTDMIEDVKARLQTFYCDLQEGWGVLSGDITPGELAVLEEAEQAFAAAVANWLTISVLDARRKPYFGKVEKLWCWNDPATGEQRVLTMDECDALGLDGTGRAG